MSYTNFTSEENKKKYEALCKKDELFELAEMMGVHNLEEPIKPVHKKKQKHKCSICRKEGHNKRTCPNLSSSDEDSDYEGNSTTEYEEYKNIIWDFDKDRMDWLRGFLESKGLHPQRRGSPMLQFLAWVFYRHSDQFGPDKPNKIEVKKYINLYNPQNRGPVRLDSIIGIGTWHTFYELI